MHPVTRRLVTIAVTVRTLPANPTTTRDNNIPDPISQSSHPIPCEGESTITLPNHSPRLNFFVSVPAPLVNNWIGLNPTRCQLSLSLVILVHSPHSIYQGKSLGVCRPLSGLL
ncbi:hypothetical protein BDV59DRAFT_173143 [Aspergillus ambiguus]|uniref:uncharacterized protein n=1 Tax=Aspergillus ambiguus TaxID=176160 RepID=UPI003CCDCF85